MARKMKIAAGNLPLPHSIMPRRISNLLLAYTFLCYFFILRFVNTENVEEPSYLQQEKIVGGNWAKITKFPHAVYLLVSCSDGNMICGSSIVNQRILVTAAHCLHCKKLKRITAQAGDDSVRQATVVRVVSIYKTHPQYIDSTLINDIGLLHLAKNLPLGNNIKRVIIETNFPIDAIAYVAGWGITDDTTRSLPFFLKKVKVPLHPRSDCSKIGHIFPGTFCAGSMVDMRNRPSKGDSGSGLITDHYKLIGLVSFRFENHIGMIVYTNVSYYYSWIKEEAKRLYCSQQLNNS